MKMKEKRKNKRHVGRSREGEEGDEKRRRARSFKI